MDSPIKKKHIDVFVCLALLCGCGPSFYLQDAKVQHLAPDFIPRLTREYQPKSISVSLSGSISPNRPYLYNNGEHSKVNERGEFDMDTVAGSVLDSNRFIFRGQNVSWNMGMAKLGLLVSHDFTKFSRVTTQIDFGGNGGAYYYDLCAALAFRVATRDIGFQFEVGAGIKDYRYYAEVARQYVVDNDIYYYTVSDMLYFQGYKSLSYFHCGFTFNGDFGMPVGFYLLGSYRYSPNIFSVADTSNRVKTGWGPNGSDDVNLNPSVFIAGVGVYGDLWKMTPFAGVTILFAADALYFTGAYPVFNVGVRRDFTIGGKKD
jgi:hypothetical protein